ncbi:MAG: PAS domain-containing protein [Ignavibacteriales bacterium]|nr:MAG: PAS domain-containing protein [Ignavibacteriales bacterium]
MKEVFNFALETALKLSGKDAGCVVRVFKNNHEFVASIFPTGKLNQKYSLFVSESLNINKWGEKGLLPVKRTAEGIKIFYQEIISINPAEEEKIILIVLTSDNKIIKPALKKSLDIICENLGLAFKESAKLKSNEYRSNRTFNDSMVKVLSIIDDAVLILNPEGIVIEANKATMEMFELPIEEISGRHLIELIPADQIGIFTKSFNSLMTERKINTINVTISKAHGGESNITFKTGIMENGNQLEYIVLTAKKIPEADIQADSKFLKAKLIETERVLKIEKSRVHQQKAILEELNRMKDEFISNISHEFRTPLASIIGFSETIDSEKDLDGETRDEFNREILNEAKRLAKLINEVLDTSLVEGKKILLNKSSFDVVSLIKELINENSAGMKAKSLVLNPDLPQGEVLIYADRKQIFDAINSLILFSISMSARSGRISIILNKFVDETELIITDTGKGIPEDIKSKILKHVAHAQAENFTSEIVHSLVFAKQIVDLHGGLFIFESEINKGTSFVMKLPMIKNLQQF